jgi:DNA-binding transcriptional LysR family regulator
MVNYTPPPSLKTARGDAASSPHDVLPRITVRDLNYVVSAAQHQSVVRAATALGISPPAVSAAIARLERIMGARLFIRRHARGMVLTDAGRQLTVGARHIMLQLRDIESAHHQDPLRVRNRLHVGCLNNIAPYILPRLFRSFAAEFPRVELRWHAEEHEFLIEKLEEGRLDLAFLLDFEMPPTLHATVMRATPAQAVLPIDHPLTGRGTIRLRALAAEPFILLDVPKTRDYFLAIFGQLGITPRIAERAHSAEMVRSLVANGFGYSLLNFSPPAYVGEREGVAYVPLKEPIRESNLVAARLHRHPVPHIIEQFIAHAKRLISRLKIVSDRKSLRARKPTHNS